MIAKLPNFADAAGSDVIVDHGDGARVRTKISKASPKRTRVKIGGVYVTGDKASAAQVKQAVSESADMLRRLGQKITRPGVQLRVGRNIPLFSVDPERPDRFLRKLNGKVERGVLVDGTFKVVD